MLVKAKKALTVLHEGTTYVVLAGTLGEATGLDNCGRVLVRWDNVLWHRPPIAGSVLPVCGVQEYAYAVPPDDLWAQ